MVGLDERRYSSASRGPAKADRAAIRDAVRATKGYQGALGVSMTFNDKGDVDTQNIYIYQVKGPEFIQVKSLNLGS